MRDAVALNVEFSRAAIARAGRSRRARSAQALASTSRPATIDFCSTTLIVDDLVFADGSTKMSVLGGGGPQTLFGAALHPAKLSLGLVAGVGESDCPPECVKWLENIGCDVSGLLPTPGMRTPRAWQITEHDGRRTQVWRHEAGDALYDMLRPRFDAWPSCFRSARALHFGVNPMRPDIELVRALREESETRFISIEPFTHALSPLSSGDLHQLVTLGDVFSPNEREARSFFASSSRMDARDLVQAMCDAGAKIVCLRRGAKGAIVYDSRANVGYECGAFSTRVVDETGCGNAFCGGFAASIAAGEGIRDGLILGTAASSIMLEHVGVPVGSIEREYRPEAVRRATLIATAVADFSLNA